ncbi:hypothetical protein D9756_001754 [Leucocoprinus leucothites]|uniref:Uncharacterized protein n=1 Tax=Leucocoprinus leucothites TaxID=201217 RepID=A0A8H5G5B9_9AGAR|nr:hypothetical protein D9756_001754 [Leucoagaricus leucothites]
MLMYFCDVDMGVGSTGRPLTTTRERFSEESDRVGSVLSLVCKAGTATASLKGPPTRHWLFGQIPRHSFDINIVDTRDAQVPGDIILCIHYAASATPKLTASCSRATANQKCDQTPNAICSQTHITSAVRLFAGTESVSTADTVDRDAAVRAGITGSIEPVAGETSSPTSSSTGSSSAEKFITENSARAMGSFRLHPATV